MVTLGSILKRTLVEGLCPPLAIPRLLREDKQPPFLYFTSGIDHRRAKRRARFALWAGVSLATVCVFMAVLSGVAAVAAAINGDALLARLSEEWLVLLAQMLLAGTALGVVGTIAIYVVVFGRLAAQDWLRAKNSYDEAAVLGRLGSNVIAARILNEEFGDTLEMIAELQRRGVPMWQCRALAFRSIGLCMLHTWREWLRSS